MNIKVDISKLRVGSNKTLSEKEAADYVRNEIESACEVFELPVMNGSVTLSTEGQNHDPVQKCSIRITAKGKTFIQSEHARTIKKAIDRAIPQLRRQMKKYKTKKIDKNRNISRNAKETLESNKADAKE